MTENRERISKKNTIMQGLILSPYLIVVRDRNRGKEAANIITVSYLGIVCEEPPIIGLAIRPSRYSYQLILDEGEFTVNLPRIEDLKAVDYCGTLSGKKRNKSADIGLKLEPSQDIKAPRIATSPVVFECRLQQIIKNSLIGGTHDYIVAWVDGAYRKKGFRIEKFEGLATTNYNYRQVIATLGVAHKLWHQ